MNKPLRKSLRTAIIAATVAVSLTGTAGAALQAHAAAPAPVPKAAQTAESQALKTLNSFYKPALKGQFPGAVAGLTVGVSTLQDVAKKIGKPEAPGKDADAFDVYHANMGNPGYAIAYKLNKIREMRYFGTNVERQTNIGGISLKMIVKQWGMPNAIQTIKSGKLVQKKVTYNRGKYVLAFIFNDNTHLDHINLTAKPVK